MAEELDPGACLLSFCLSSSMKVMTRAEFTDIKNYGKSIGAHESFGTDLDLFQE